MSTGHEQSAGPDADPADGRNETTTERLDRNWNEILQELRVTQTGTQILTGFLLTLPFQQRFTDLNDVQVTIYVVLVLLASLATVLGLAPVSFHRTLFRQKAKAEIVALADRFLQATLVCVALLVAGVILFILDVVISVEAAIIASVIAVVVLVLAWLVLPLSAHPRRRRP